METKDLETLKPGDKVVIPAVVHHASGPVLSGYLFETFNEEFKAESGYKEIELTLWGCGPASVMIEPPPGFSHWTMGRIDYDTHVKKYGQDVCDAAGMIVGVRGWWVTPSAILRKVDVAQGVASHNYDPGGCNCDKCGELSPYSVPNTTEGKFVCYGCRQDPYRGSVLCRR